jgi:hypothetical protein
MHWAGVAWLVTGTDGGVFEQVNELTDSIKKRGLLDQLSVLLVLASREGLCFMESVTR